MHGHIFGFLRSRLNYVVKDWPKLGHPAQLGIIHSCMCACTFKDLLNISYDRPLDKSANWKISFFISHPKHMLWVLKRTVSMRRFF